MTTTQQTAVGQLLILTGALYFGGKIIEAITPAYDTVNYALKYKGRIVYHGIVYEDRLDCRLAEHRRSGKVFDFCLYDHPTTRECAAKIERKRIRRDSPKYNKQHNYYC